MALLEIQQLKANQQVETEYQVDDPKFEDNEGTLKKTVSPILTTFPTSHYVTAVEHGSPLRRHFSIVDIQTQEKGTQTPSSSSASSSSSDIRNNKIRRRQKKVDILRN